ncbi:protein DYAD [Senna tora]|uniref:Protein DYAD n=1 Tax=Senna tora TaxID=362788 RepID=A0A835C795_9FABA|nr:protein DYAD [Senna tora]
MRPTQWLFRQPFSNKTELLLQATSAEAAVLRDYLTTWLCMAQLAFACLGLQELCEGLKDPLAIVSFVEERGAGMENWGTCHQVAFIAQHEENNTQMLYGIPKEDLEDDEELRDQNEVIIKTEALFMPEFKKRKRLSRSQLREMKAGLGGNQVQTSSKVKTKKNEHRDRWSSERYELAEKRMWEVLKSKGATFANPISRPDLRVAARKLIGDTGLLDHLLKHIDGKVAPGGAERFRRWFNTKGTMEYWLESANLHKIRQDAGVQDPYWIPPSTFKAGSPPENSDSSGELKLLQEEMAKLKNFTWQETHKELVKWKAMTEQRLTGIMASLNGVQGMYGELIIWKSKMEQQLVEITNKLNELQASREHLTFNPPPERWEDWLESSNLDNIQGDELVAPWFGSTQLLNVQQEVALQDPNSVLPTQLLNDELTNAKSDFLEVVPNKQEEDQLNVTPDSSITDNSKSDLDNSLVLYQEMFIELFKWKDKADQQLTEISNIVHGMLRTK